LLEPGEIVPCDGIFLSGHNIKCDESGATGESDAIKKVSYAEWMELRTKNLADGKDVNAGHTDCFVISGSKVLEGVGKYVVVAVGTKSFNGRIMMGASFVSGYSARNLILCYDFLALRGDTENTPLQLKLNDLAELIAKIGSIAGLALFTALMIRFFVQLGTGSPARYVGSSVSIFDPRTKFHFSNANENGIAFVNILIIAVTLVVVAVPEGKHFVVKKTSRVFLII